MAALKRCLGQGVPAEKGITGKMRARSVLDRRQGALLLPVAGSRKKKEEPATEPTTLAAKGRRKV